MLTSSNAGKAPIVVALRIINEIASVLFHMPFCVSPTIWPTRRTLAIIPVCSTAALMIVSVINFDRAYPIF